jgi:hypothetical protein
MRLTASVTHALDFPSEPDVDARRQAGLDGNICRDHAPLRLRRRGRASAEAGCRVEAVVNLAM